MSTVTLAKIYEKQGHTQEALSIYRALLDKDPKNSEAKKAIQKIVGVKKHKSSDNSSKVSYFINMHTKEQFYNFERWLVKPWS